MHVVEGEQGRAGAGPPAQERHQGAREKLAGRVLDAAGHRLQRGTDAGECFGVRVEHRRRPDSAAVENESASRVCPLGELATRRLFPIPSAPSRSTSRPSPAVA